MSRVGVATCAGEDVDPDSPVLLAALGRGGVDAELAVWDDPNVEWGRYDLVVVRSTWDYAPRCAQFLNWARGVPRLLNPPAVLAYSTDKHYLADLAARGVAVVHTFYCDVGTTPEWPDGDVVVKPCVGAGSLDAERYGAPQRAAARAHVARLHAANRDVLIQPYVASVDEGGELALVFIDGSFSHAMVKGAMLNVPAPTRDVLFRRQQMRRAVGDPDALALAHRVLEPFSDDELLYARVDLVRVNDQWALMELELVEPSLFLGYDPDAATKLADALARRLA